MLSCEDGASQAEAKFCEFSQMVMAKKFDIEESEWFGHWQIINAENKLEWDPM
jgi:hypothetical protein